MSRRLLPAVSGGPGPRGWACPRRSPLSGSLARWQLPDTVIYLDALPRTSVGKLDKKAMRAAYADTYRQAASAEAPTG
jgi:acyl-CoA synthetase (AMP-forming)/AMP-acid ligase II